MSLTYSKIPDKEPFGTSHVVKILSDTFGPIYVVCVWPCTYDKNRLLKTPLEPR